MFMKENNVYVRQSWLGDALMCMERARLAIVSPEWSVGSDATMLGTGVHAGIEHYIKENGNASLDDMQAVMRLNINTSEEKFKWNNLQSYDAMFKVGDGLLKAWWDDIRKHVELGGLVEQKFTVPVGTFNVDGSTMILHYSGTMDYVEPSGRIWDWKTAGRKYSQSEKQKQSVQASVYATAAVKLGLTASFPVSFMFGVMTKTSKPEGQIVEVVRTAAHSSWLEVQARNIVSAALRMGRTNVWPQVDQHNLCSEKWCPWWSICKGSHISDLDNSNNNSK